MRVVFVTHNELGLACLRELVDQGADVRAIFTRSDRNEISDQVLFDEFATRHNIEVHRVESVNTDSSKKSIADYEPELLFVIGWSRLVDSEVISLPSQAALGMHPAPLPRGRGRAPLAWSLIKGLDETALSFFHLEEEADAGDLVGQIPIPIEIEDDALSLYEKTIDAGRELIQKHYPEFNSGQVPRSQQDKDKATWWPKREPHHGLIDWTQPPAEVYNWIRGQTRPYPGAFSYINDYKITLWEAKPPGDSLAYTEPGELLYAEDGVLGIGAWEGIIEVTEVEVNSDGAIPGDALVSEYEFELGNTFTNIRDCVDIK